MARTRAPKAWSRSLNSRPGTTVGRLLGPLRYLFSFHGRINRTQYWLYWVILIGVFIASQVFFGFAGGTAIRNPTIFQQIMGLLTLLTWITFPILATICCAMIHIKRFHDLGKTGLLSLVALIPVVGTAWVLVQCGFLKGTEGPNWYDRDQGFENLTEVFE